MRALERVLQVQPFLGGFVAPTAVDARVHAALAAGGDVLAHALVALPRVPPGQPTPHWPVPSPCPAVRRWALHVASFTDAERAAWGQSLF